MERFISFSNATLIPEEGRPLRVAGYLQHYNKRNDNGQLDMQGAYDNFIKKFTAKSASLPLVLMHNDTEAEHIIGKFIELEDRPDGLYGVAEIISTPYIDAEIIPKIKAGIWPCFSTAGYIIQATKADKGYDVHEAELVHIALVSLPADRQAKAKIINKKQPLNSVHMDKKQIIKSMRNALDLDVSEVLKDTLMAAINELEASEELHSMEQAIEAIKNKLDSLVSVEQLADVENALRAAIAGPKDKCDYLNTKQAMKDFANALKESRGNTKIFGEVWGKMLSSNGINDPDGVLLPRPLLVQLTDRLRDSWLWGLLRHTGLPAVMVGFNESAGNGNNSTRAGGHVPGGEKAIQPMELVGRTIRAQAIYKLVEIPYETLREADEDVLLQYVNEELVRSLVAELERCVLVHDGRADSDPRHVTAVKPIKTDSWAEKANYDPAEMLDGVMDGLGAITTQGPRLLVASRATLLKLRRRLYAAGGTPTYLTDEQLAAELGVEAIISCPNYDTLGDGTIIAFDREQYITVGAERDTLYAYDIRHNTHIYEIVQMVGGALATRGAAVVLTPQGQKKS